MKNRNYLIMALAVLLMVSMLCFAGCGKKDKTPAPTEAPLPVPTMAPTEAPTEAPTIAPTEAPTEPAPTEPAWEAGVARAGYTEAVYSLLNKGEAVEVSGKFAHYYVITAEPYDLLVDERFVRLDNERPFDDDKLYAKNKRPVYDNVYMNNEPIATLKQDTKLTVLEGKDDWVYVEWSGGKGYMKEDDTSARKLGGSRGGGGGSSGPADGSNVDIGNLSAAEIRGGISLLGAYYGPEKDSAYNTPVKGTILAENVEAYIALFKVGEEMKVVSYDNEYCTIYLDDGVTAKVRRVFVKMPGDSEEATYTGYMKKNSSVLYYDYQNRTEGITPGRNETVEVLYKLPAHMHDGDEIYVVRYGGDVMYTLESSVSESKIKSNSNGGGGSSGGSSSSSGGAVWTPPQM